MFRCYAYLASTNQTTMKLQDVEKEVQARVDFKMNELLTALENAAKLNWHVALRNNSQKHTYYWEAFDQMKQMLGKEMRMATPRNDMAEQQKRIKRDEAISKIMERFCDRGDRDYLQKERLLVSIIENAQNW